MKQVIKSANIVLAGICCLLMAGCYKDVRLPDSISGGSGSTSGGTAVPADSVTFVKYVVPIFTANCITCHSGNESPDLRSANAYSALINGGYVLAGNATGSVLYQKVSSGAMPPDGPLKQTDIDIIKNWILNGALNN